MAFRNGITDIFTDGIRQTDQADDGKIKIVGIFREIPIGKLVFCNTEYTESL
jgi:hypothetical protein